jgi:nicotinic acetylcholine receptor, invertebrate
MLNSKILFLLLLNSLYIPINTYSYNKNNNSLHNYNPQKELKDFIIDTQYHKTIPSNKGRVNVTLGIAFRAFDSIDHIEGTINMNIWLRYNWQDKNYGWNPLEWNNITNIKLNSDPELDNSLWTPDIYLYNTAEKPLNELDYSNIVLNYDGSIFWSRPGLLKSTCQFDLTYFPFDTQLCYLKFGSWSYDSSEIFLKKNNISIDISNLQENEEWIIGDYYTIKNSVKYACCNHEYEDIEFFYELKRKSEYYNINIIIPTFSTASLMILTLLVPWDSGERISFAVTILLSIIVFLLILSDNLPKTDKYPLLSKMIIGLIYFSLIGVIFTVLINALKSYMEKKDYESNTIKNSLLNKFITRFSCKDNNLNINIRNNSKNESDIERTHSYLETIKHNNLKIFCEDFITKIEYTYISLFILGFIIYCSVIFTNN